MCLLVKAAANTQFPFNWFKDCYRKNSHGFSIAYVRDGQVVVQKNLFSGAQSAYNFWKARAPVGIDYAIHWRMKTHGAIDLARVHPYRVTDDLWIMHNGMLDDMRDPDPKKSDTQIYAETIALELGDTVFNPGVQKLIGESIGLHNRFIFLHSTLGMCIINAHTGVTSPMFPGCWFSNLYAWTPSQWGIKQADRWNNVRWDFGDYVSDPWPQPRTVDEKAQPKRIFSKAEVETLVSKITELCEKVYDHAAEVIRYEDMAAVRFRQRFDSAAEFEDYVTNIYLSVYDLYDDLSTAWQYLDAGHITYSDVMEWFNLDHSEENYEHR